MEFLTTINLIATGMLFLWMLSRSATIDDDTGVQSQIKGIQSIADKALSISEKSLGVSKETLDLAQSGLEVQKGSIEALVEAHNNNHEVIQMLIDELGYEFVPAEEINEVKEAHLKKVTKKKK